MANYGTIVLLLSLVPVLWAALPGLMIQVNQAGINKFAAIGVELLDHTLPGTHIPDTSGKSAPESKSLFTWKLTNIYIRTFHVSTNHAHVSLHPTDNVAVSIHFHGDIIDEILDLFEKYIADYVKGEVNGIICHQISSIITNEGNNFLREIPISISLPNPMAGFHIDYGLTENPIARPSYIAVPLLAKFWYAGHEHDGAIPPAHGTIAPARSDQDLCLDFDADEIFGSAAYALQVSPLSHFTIDQDVLGHFGSAIQHFMQCHCADGLCIGCIIPEVGKACGPGGVVDVSAQATAAVRFSFNSSGAFGDLQATAGFQSHLPNGDKSDLFHITVVADLEVPSTLRFEGWAIKGRVLVTGADLKLGNSLIGNIDIDAVRQVWDTVLKVVVERTISRLLEAGIPLPRIPYMNIVNPHIWFGPHALTFCTDAQYTG